MHAFESIVKREVAVDIEAFVGNISPRSSLHRYLMSGTENVLGAFGHLDRQWRAGVRRKGVGSAVSVWVLGEIKVGR